mgnify:CR=1 FL=1
MAPWVEHVMWWQVYPLGFAGVEVRDEHRPPAPEGGLRSLIPWVEHIQELGLNGLLLGPIFSSSTHGYDSVDWFSIDERLGTRADFDDLIAHRRARGIRLLLDGVFNHVGREHPWAQRALAEGRAGELADWFRIDWDAPGGPRFADFEGHESLVALNHANEGVIDAVRAAMAFWLDAGADGWRLDAAYAVEPGFWARVLPPVRAANPQAWILGEMIHGDYAAYVEASGIDSVTEYELWKATWSSLKEENFFELDWTLGRHNALLDSFVPQTFVGNHDVTRIATQVGHAKAVLALTVLATVGGIPSIYYGDEVGLEALKEERLGGDDAIRPAFPPSPAQLDVRDGRLMRAHQDLIGLRRRHPWLLRARTETVELTNTRYTYRVSSGSDAEALLVTLDVSQEPFAEIATVAGEVRFSSR